MASVPGVLKILSKTDVNAPIYSAKLKSIKPQFYSLLGAFPDEPMLEVIDRMLYYAGARRVQKLIGLPTAIDGCDDSRNCEIVVECPSSRPKCKSTCPADCNKCNSPCCTPSPPSPSKKVVTCAPAPCCKSCKKTPCCCKCNQTPKKLTPRVDFSGAVPDEDKSPVINKIGKGIRRSISLCSLACLRLRSKQPETGKKCGKCNDQKWLWTRFVSQSNGCKFYEVYKNSDCKSNPKKGNLGPSIIFVVLPNGCIMPFETMPCNK